MNLTRPSEMNRLWHYCPGSHQAQEGMPDQKTDEATRGEMLHKAVQDHLTMGSTFVEGMDDSLIEDVEEVFNKIVLIRDKMKPVTTSIEYAIGPVLSTVVQINPDHGAIDVMFVNKEEKRVAIVDIKSEFYQQPPADEHLQLILYMLGAHELFPDSDVTGYIVRPKHRTEQFHPSADDFIKWTADIQTFLKEQVYIDNPIRRPHEKGCQYCKAFGTERCIETKDIAEGVVDLVVKGTDLVLTDDWITKLIQYKTQIEKLIKLASKTAQEMKAADPAALPDLAIKNGYTKKYVADTTLMFQNMFKRFLADGKDPISAEEFIAISSVSRAKLADKVVGEYGMTKKDAAGWIEAVGDAAIGSSEVSQSIVYKPSKETT